MPTPARTHDYKGRVIRVKKTHRRYRDDQDRPDLRALAKCCDLSGPRDEAYLTSDPAAVTCGRCLRIMRQSDSVRARIAKVIDGAVAAEASWPEGAAPAPPLTMQTDENDHSAWAPVCKAIRWLRLLEKQPDVAYEIHVDAGNLADELARALPRLGGGQFRG